MSASLRSYNPPATVNPYKMVLRSLIVLGYFALLAIPVGMYTFGVDWQSIWWGVGVFLGVLWIVWNIILIGVGISMLVDKSDEWDRQQRNMIND